MKKIVLAIDGPAGSGKSTTAKLVALALGYRYIDTGAMYRAVTLKVLQNNISESDEEKISSLLATTSVEFMNVNETLKVLLDGNDVTDAIRSIEVTNAVSAVSAIDSVRKKMVDLQRQMGNDGGVVLEGRDIGTVVFPNAELKIFLTASVEERAKRRQNELRTAGINIRKEDVSKQLVVRDTKDSSRIISPLVKATDAIELDTSNITIDEQVAFIVAEAKKKLLDNIPNKKKF